MADTGQVAWQQFAHVPDRLVGDPGEDASGTAGIYPQQTSDQLPPHLSECLHSRDVEAPRNDRHGRRADRLNLTGVGRKQNGSFSGRSAHYGASGFAPIPGEGAAEMTTLKQA
jgi:hypothetical protein